MPDVTQVESTAFKFAKIDKGDGDTRPYIITFETTEPGPLTLGFVGNMVQKEQTFKVFSLKLVIPRKEF